ncbi:transmembrane regulator ToxS [Vibrio cholerae]|uniref:transmembrane regulator ToxS n=1 Tax=Vibrio cholerae TaxID=666 RepID=UPI00166E0863|nr:transmembrane regulator ToxS [Vibrio cholerae]GFK54391.1 Transmembrane regulatory protein ToxS [Vibrio cholerae]GFK58203.1 Transmembrane regulatory protein ToxS [Vibrio cholerae]GFK61752.1 Transmembrane regulatory protein ToxS [Vibrio cholerae]GFK65296.1 Transmembrane regulatory protein ToxS [Vibrio cholerae]GFK68533.1 Transmembrane regulatory protein ToxS [Vibrio cholerae]
MQNRHIAMGILLLSLLLSSWLYWGSDFKLEQVLTSREWQSKMVSLIKTNSNRPAMGPLSRVDVTSNVKYLPNGTYLRVSIVKLFSDDNSAESVINISEFGEWDISDNYLLVTPVEFKDISSNQNEQLQLITQLFKMDAQQSRRVDIVNERTILFTSLSHGSTVLFSNS